MRQSNRKQESYPITQKVAYLIPLLTSPVFMIFLYLGHKGRGTAAWVGLIVVGFLIRTFWGLRERALFWLTIAIVVSYHIPLIFMIPWPDQPISRFAMLPIATLDLAVGYGMIRIVEYVVERRTLPDTAESEALTAHDKQVPTHGERL